MILKDQRRLVRLFESPEYNDKTEWLEDINFLGRQRNFPGGSFNQNFKNAPNYPYNLYPTRNPREQWNNPYNTQLNSLNQPLTKSHQLAYHERAENEFNQYENVGSLGEIEFMFQRIVEMQIGIPIKSTPR